VIFEDRSKSKIKAQVNGLGFAFCGYGNVYILSFWHLSKKLRLLHLLPDHPKGFDIDIIY
jgi:hypothetical protein